jgi:hypothetical protein
MSGAHRTQAGVIVTSESESRDGNADWTGA